MLNRKVLAAWTTMTLPLAACSATETLKEATSDVACAANGCFQGAGGVFVLGIDAGPGDDDFVRAQARIAVQQAAEEGATLRTYIIDGPSFASIGEVVVPELPDGSLRPEGANGKAQRESTAEHVELTMRAIDQALEDRDRSSQGRDLLGFVEHAGRLVQPAVPAEPAVIVLVSAGGVHRVPDGDAVEQFLANGALTPPPHTELPSGAELHIVGAGRFTGADVQVDRSFAEAITDWWGAFCTQATSSGAPCSVDPALPADLPVSSKES